METPKGKMTNRCAVCEGGQLLSVALRVGERGAVSTCVPGWWELWAARVHVSLCSLLASAHKAHENSKQHRLALNPVTFMLA